MSYLSWLVCRNAYFRASHYLACLEAYGMSNGTAHHVAAFYVVHLVNCIELRKHRIHQAEHEQRVFRRWATSEHLTQTQASAMLQPGVAAKPILQVGILVRLLQAFTGEMLWENLEVSTTIAGDVVTKANQEINAAKSNDFNRMWRYYMIEDELSYKRLDEFLADNDICVDLYVVLTDRVVEKPYELEIEQEIDDHVYEMVD